MIKKRQTPEQKVFNRMAQIIKEIDNLEDEYDDLEIQALAYKTEKYEHPNGVFTRRESTKYKVLNKTALIKIMGAKVYKEASTIGKRAIVRAVGKKGFEKALEKGCMGIKSQKTYYRFTKKKG